MAGLLDGRRVGKPAHMADGDGEAKRVRLGSNFGLRQVQEQRPAAGAGVSYPTVALMGCVGILFGLCSG